MIDSRGIIGSALQWLFADPDLSLKASTGLTWIMLIVYGIWHAAPFSFIVFYAGLQTLPQDTLESAQIDGASRWQQVRYVIIPHLMPLITFIALMQLMDNFRVFEPIVGFNSEAHAASLSWFIFNDLGGNPPPSSAATSSVLTIIGVSILLTPVLIRTWRDLTQRVNESLINVIIIFIIHQRQPLTLKLLIWGFIGLWLIIAAFPFIWTLWGSFKIEADFFSKANWANALFAPRTIEEHGTAFIGAGYDGAWVQEEF